METPNRRKKNVGKNKQRQNTSLVFGGNAHLVQTLFFLLRHGDEKRESERRSRSSLVVARVQKRKGKTTQTMCFFFFRRKKSEIFSFFSRASRFLVPFIFSCLSFSRVFRFSPHFFHFRFIFSLLTPKPCPSGRGTPAPTPFAPSRTRRPPTEARAARRRPSSTGGES